MTWIGVKYRPYIEPEDFVKTTPLIDAAIKGYVAADRGEFPPCNPYAPYGVISGDNNSQGHAWFHGYWTRMKCERGEPKVKIKGTEMNPINPMQTALNRFFDRFALPKGDLTNPSVNREELCAKLIAEEADEVVEAILDRDLPLAVDGLCDLIYVCFYAAVAFGVNLQPFFDEVHRTNMLKVGGGTREDGKILKPPGWEGPKIKEMLVERGYKEDE